MSRPPIRILVAEDSATVRDLLVQLLSQDAEIRLAGTASNGRSAVEQTRKLRPDVVLMDANMPELDGFGATKQIMMDCPTPIVIVTGTLDVTHVGVSVAALAAGALAVLRTPTLPSTEEAAGYLRQFFTTIKSMAGMKLVRHARPVRTAARPSMPSKGQAQRFRLVAMAASTGGPAVLARILGALPADYSLPILVVQHMSEGFIGGLADWLNSVTPLFVKVAEPGERLRCGTVYLAPDRYHLCVDSRGRVQLDDGPPNGGFKPSANRLFESMAATYGQAGLALVLTGMGRDGADGAKRVHDIGGRVLVQDEASAVVFGMPASVLTIGATGHPLGPEDLVVQLKQAAALPPTSTAE